MSSIFQPFVFWCGVTVMQLREELERALEEVNNNDEIGERIAEASPESFTDLVKDMVLNRQDIKAFAFKTKAMVTTINFLIIFKFVSCPSWLLGGLFIQCKTQSVYGCSGLPLKLVHWCPLLGINHMGLGFLPSTHLI